MACLQGSDLAGEHSMQKRSEDALVEGAIVATTRPRGRGMPLEAAYIDIEEASVASVASVAREASQSSESVESGLEVVPHRLPNQRHLRQNNPRSNNTVPKESVDNHESPSSAADQEGGSQYSEPKKSIENHVTNSTEAKDHSIENGQITNDTDDAVDNLVEETASPYGEESVQVMGSSTLASELQGSAEPMIVSEARDDNTKKKRPLQKKTTGVKTPADATDEGTIAVTKNGRAKTGDKTKTADVHDPTENEEDAVTENDNDDESNTPAPSTKQPDQPTAHVPIGGERDDDPGKLDTNVMAPLEMDTNNSLSTAGETSRGVWCDTTSGRMARLACKTASGIHAHPIAFALFFLCFCFFGCRRCRRACVKRRDDRGEYRAVAAQYGEMLFDNTFDDNYSYTDANSVGSVMSDDGDDWSQGPKVEMSRIRGEVNGGLTLEEMNG